MPQQQRDTGRDPALEQRIITEVASEGRQLGRLLDAVGVPARHQDRESSTIEDQRAMDQLQELAEQIAATKTRAERIDQIVADVRALRADPETNHGALQRLREALMDEGARWQEINRHCHFRGAEHCRSSVAPQEGARQTKDTAMPLSLRWHRTTVVLPSPYKPPRRRSGPPGPGSAGPTATSSPHPPTAPPPAPRPAAAGWCCSTSRPSSPSATPTGSPAGCGNCSPTPGSTRATATASAPSGSTSPATAPRLCPGQWGSARSARPPFRPHRHPVDATPRPVQQLSARQLVEDQLGAADPTHRRPATRATAATQCARNRNPTPRAGPAQTASGVKHEQDPHQDLQPLGEYVSTHPRSWCTKQFRTWWRRRHG